MMINADTKIMCNPGIDNTTKIRVLQSRSIVRKIVLSILILFFLSMTSVSYSEDPLNVVIIKSANTSIYTDTAKSIETVLNSSSGDRIRFQTITVNDLQSDNNSLQKLPAIYVPIGQHALTETIRVSGVTPILATLISRNGYKDVMGNPPVPLGRANIGAIFIDQPIKRILEFTNLALPNIGVHGFVVSSGNDYRIESIHKLSSKLNYYIEKVDKDDNVIRSFSNALSHSNVIIALPDHNIFNSSTTRNILLSSYRKRVPIIGFSKAYVKAGALAAIYSTPELIGKQTGEYIKELSLDTLNKPLPKLYSRYFSISVNNSVSRSLGLPQLKASELNDRLLNLEGGHHD